MIHDEFKQLLATQFKSHPWHGVSPGDNAPDVVESYIEIVTNTAVKLELCKATGHLRVDRPQRFSSMCPMLYGFIPQTYCGETIAELCMKRTGLKNVKGDGDPLDICVLADPQFAHGDLFLTVRPIGGLRMVDKGQADDKIVAVLENDLAFRDVRDISKCPPALIERLQHYFLSYKRPPGSTSRKQVVEIRDVYGRKEAQEVIRRSLADYATTFGTAEDRLEALKQLLVNAVIEEMQARGLVGNGNAANSGKKSRISASAAKRLASPKPRGR